MSLLVHIIRRNKKIFFLVFNFCISMLLSHGHLHHVSIALCLIPAPNTLPRFSVRSRVVRPVSMDYLWLDDASCCHCLSLGSAGIWRTWVLVASFG